MSNHIPKNNLKEKKLNLTKKNAIIIDEIDMNEIAKKSKAQTEEAINIYAEIMEVFKNHDTNLREAYLILASIMESIYTYSIMEDFGINIDK